MLPWYTVTGVPDDAQPSRNSAPGIWWAPRATTRSEGLRCAVRSRLDNAAFERAWAEGRAADLDYVVAEALAMGDGLDEVG